MYILNSCMRLKTGRMKSKSACRKLPTKSFRDWKTATGASEYGCLAGILPCKTCEHHWRVAGVMSQRLWKAHVTVRCSAMSLLICCMLAALGKCIEHQITSMALTRSFLQALL